jgi:hypothetical protein
MKASILNVIMIPQPGFGCVVTLQSKPAPTESVYHESRRGWGDGERCGGEEG